jgi:N-acetylmuramoyl-L-alanine amidase
VLLEAGIIVNRDEERRLDDAVHRADIVDAVVAAVQATCAVLEDAPDRGGMR